MISVKKITYDLSGVPVKLDSISTNPRLGLYAATLAELYMRPFVPFLTGFLVGNTRIKAFLVSYMAPYAHYQYRGISKLGAALRYTKPGAGKEWDRSMMSARSADFSSALTAFVGGM